MDNVTKTQWFTDEQPVHTGVYERDMSRATEDDADMPYAYWDGDKWLLSGETPDDALDNFSLPSSYQDFPWRGVAE